MAEHLAANSPALRFAIGRATRRRDVSRLALYFSVKLAHLRSRVYEKDN